MVVDVATGVEIEIEVEVEVNVKIEIAEILTVEGCGLEVVLLLVVLGAAGRLWL